MVIAFVFIIIVLIFLSWVFNHEQNGFKAKGHRIKIIVLDDGIKLYKPQFKRFGFWWSYIKARSEFLETYYFSIIFDSEEKALQYINKNKETIANKNKYKQRECKYINID